MDYFSGETFCIDKPLGWTSFDAVKRLRGAIQKRLGLKKFKVGHAGTLDPLASGILLVCTGRATRSIERLQAGVKEYVATLQLGATTPSFDLETEIDQRRPYEHITRADVESCLERFRGDIMQTPPAFSAVKVDGKRAYSMARAGKEVELKPKLLRIDEIELLDFSTPLLTLRIVCSKGTYIRALARDIGEALGCGAHLTALRRTRVGDYSEKEVLSLDEACRKIASDPVEIPDWVDTATADKCRTRLEAAATKK